MRRRTTSRELSDLLATSSETIARVAATSARHYDPFDFRRTPGQGRWRHIDNPIGHLKELQSAIHQQVLSPHLRVDDSSGPSIVKNAAPHTGKPVVVTLDLRDCFFRISDRAVFRVFVDVLGFTRDAANILTKLTTRHHRLALGAPTSPGLAEIALEPLRGDIRSIASAFAVTATFYVDDIALSGARAPDVIEPIIRAIAHRRHSVRRGKVRVMRRSREQIVTGVAVNNGTTVPVDYMHKVEAEIMSLSGEACVSNGRLTSLQGKIAHAYALDPFVGERLDELLTSMQPSSVGDKPTAQRREKRACRGRCRASASAPLRQRRRS
jgi:hypothetical protein